MSNPHKGQGVDFKVGDDAYKLSFSADALAEVEDALDMTVNQISAAMQDPEKFRINMVRTLFWGGLLDHHGFDMPAARKVFKTLTVHEAIELIGKAFTLAFPEAKVSTGNGAANPPKPGEPAADGTGPIS